VKKCKETKEKCQCISTNQAFAISAQRLAKMLSISKRTVHRLDSSGRLPKPFRLGGSVRWNRREIENWIKAGCPVRKQWEAMKEVAHAR